jgi:hypothetical protein
VGGYSRLAAEHLREAVDLDVRIGSLQRASGGEEGFHRLGCIRVGIGYASEGDRGLRRIPHERAHARVMVEGRQALRDAAAGGHVAQKIGLGAEPDHGEPIGVTGRFGPDALGQAVAPPGEAAGLA